MLNSLIQIIKLNNEISKFPISTFIIFIIIDDLEKFRKFDPERRSKMFSPESNVIRKTLFEWQCFLVLLFSSSNKIKTGP